MIQTQITISNKLGLHARASAKLTKLASSFSCSIKLTKGARTVDAKSIMGVMMVAAGIGTVVTMQYEGADEIAADAAISALFADKFGEGE